MENKTTIAAMLDNNSYKKIKEFSVMNNISQSEIVRVLLNKIPLKINARDIGTVIQEAKEKGKVNKKSIQIYITDELVVKLRKMILLNNTSYSEIIRYVISTTDFSSMTFKTKGEIMHKVKSKKK